MNDAGFFFLYLLAVYILAIAYAPEELCLTLRVSNDFLMA